MDIIQLLSSRNFVSGEEIAGILNISRAAVHKKILKLRTQGYEITGQKNLGYTLLSRPDIVAPEEIQNYLPNNIGIFYYNSTDSTQLRAKELAGSGCGEGSIVIAENQTASYGRMGRQWLSQEKGLWFSLLLRPNVLPDRVPQITLLFSIAICRAIEKLYHINAQIKWPNDIFLNGLKLAGILTEMSSEVGSVHWVVTGVGLNANNEIVDSLKNTAVSLNIVLGRKVNRSELLAEILICFNAIYKRFSSDGFAPFLEEYNNLMYVRNKVIRVETGSRTVEGHAEYIDADGYLRLKQENGEIIKIIAGDVLKV